MSVSEGIKKYFNKNYYVKLIGEDKSVQKLKIQPWTKAYELKIKISQKYFVNYKNIRLFYCNIEMLDNNNMLDYKIIDAKNSEIFYKFSDVSDKAISLQVYGGFSCSKILNDLIENVKLGFLEGLIPNLIPDGTSGTYKLKNSTKEVIALFKPIDEEAFAPNNQKGYTGKFGQESFRKGILSGEGSIREVVAYLLDKKNFFKVPETTFVEISHPSFNKNDNGLLMIEENSIPKIRNSIIHNFVIENLISSPITVAEIDDKIKNNTCVHHNRHISTKATAKEDIFSSEKSDNSKTLDTDYRSCHKSNDLDITNNSINNNTHSKKNTIKKYGSFQKFIKSDDVAANYSSSLFDTYEIHKLAILDIRILNCDRNDENILIRKRKSRTTGKTHYRMIPIDHSLSFPDCIKISEYEMCWMSWDQSNEPFCEELKQYIRKINIMDDMNRLSKAVKMRERCWKNFRIANLVLKTCCDYNLNLFQIGSILYRPGFKDLLSDIEKLVTQANKTYYMYKTIFENNISSDALSFNIKNGKFLNSGIKVFDSNKSKKVRTTSIDFYPIHKNSDPSTLNIKHKNLLALKENFSEFKKNLLIKYVEASIEKTGDDNTQRLFCNNISNSHNNININNSNANKKLGNYPNINDCKNSCDSDEYANLKAENNKKKKNIHNNSNIDNNNTNISNNKTSSAANSINNNISNKKVSKDFEVIKQNSEMLVKGEKEIFEKLDDGIYRKRKRTCLLRKTTSVPKLLNLEISENDKGKENLDINNKDISNNSSEEKEKNLNLNINLNITNQLSDKLSNKTTTRKSLRQSKNDKITLNEVDFENEKANEVITELDSPYNELFFYLFENILEDFLRAKYNKK